MRQVGRADAILSSAFGRLRPVATTGGQPGGELAHASGTSHAPGLECQSPIRFVKDGETVSAMCVEIDRVAQAVTDVVILVEGDDSRLQRGDLHLVQVDGVADMIWSSGWQVRAAARFRMQHRRRSRYQ